jgi:hypothetical protein
MKTFSFKVSERWFDVNSCFLVFAIRALQTGTPFLYYSFRYRGPKYFLEGYAKFD